MTRDKWHEINQKLQDKLNDQTSKYSTIPENWIFAKDDIMEYIRSMDEVTEVYFMENKEK